MADATTTERVHGYCALCIARCGCVAVVEDGRFTRLEPDPAHPTGQALCAKGRAAPELVYHRERLTHPLRRTRRLANAFGTPNAAITLDVCGWGRAFATRYTYGVGSVGAGGGGAMPDIENS